MYIGACIPPLQFLCTTCDLMTEARSGALFDAGASRPPRQAGYSWEMESARSGSVCAVSSFVIDEMTYSLHIGTGQSRWKVSAPTIGCLQLMWRLSAQMSNLPIIACPERQRLLRPAISPSRRLTQIIRTGDGLGNAGVGSLDWTQELVSGKERASAALW